MIASFIQRVINFFPRLGRWRWLGQLVIFLVIIIPVALLAIRSYRDDKQQLTDLVVSRKEAIAFLAASTLKEKLDRTIDVGVSLSTRGEFQKLIEAGKWDEAIKILERVPHDFTYIDRVSLFDPQGILKAATQPTPEILAVIGKDFSFRDYYQGVSKNWEPYVAEAIKPAVPLGYNLVPVAIPIKSEIQKILGILLLNIKLDTVAAWSKSINVGPAGFVYIVDSKGHLVAHPTLLPAEEIVDFSSVPAVQKALGGEHGVEVLYNPIEKEEQLSAYYPVAGYGWAVVAQQPILTAFALRDARLRQIIIQNAAILFFLCLFVYFILRFFDALYRYRQKEKLFLESIGDGVAAIDRSWNITLWNNAASVISGWSYQEAVGKPFREVIKFIREQDRKENIVFIEEAMLYGKPRAMEDHTIVLTKDGREIPVGDSAAPIINEKGEVSGAIIIFRDISKERESQRLRSDFAYASHQLRTPVNQALWALENVQETGDEKKVREGLLDAYHSVKSVQKLVNELLEVSPIDQGTVVPKREPVSLAKIMSEVRETLKKEGKVRNLAIALIPIDPSLKVSTDPRLLKRALEAVVENALYYSVPASIVEVKAEKQAEGLLVEVRDSGIGIPSEQQPLVFTKFFRGSNVPVQSIGAGLGLFIAREYVKLLGGKMWFVSKEGEGSTFSILLLL